MQAWLAVVLLGASAGSVACPICLGAGQRTVAQQLAAAQQVVLAMPTADTGRFHVAEVIRGERPLTRSIEAGYPRTAVAVDNVVPKGQAVLLVHEDPLPGLVVLGAIGIDQAAWLRKLAVGKNVEEFSLQEWRDRVALVVPRLQHPQPLVAKIAYGDLAAAPYAALRTAKPQLDARALRAWLADPALAARQRLYLLLLGFAGNTNDAAALDQRLEAAWKSGDPANLASLLTADLELRGAARLKWVEAKYLQDRSRSPAELEAALLALSVHGNAPGVLSRDQVIQSYRMFMKARPEIAGFVARDLAAWQYWDVVPDYVALMKSDVRQQFPSKLAILAYLQQSPFPEARDLGRKTQALPATGQ